MRKLTAIAALAVSMISFACFATGDMCFTCNTLLRTTVYSIADAPYLEGTQLLCSDCFRSETRCWTCTMPFKKMTRLSDGRYLCKSCSKLSVLSGEELDQVFAEIKDDLFQLLRPYGKLPDRNIRFSVVDGPELERLGRTRRFPHDRLTLGVTRPYTKEEKNHYDVAVLSGFRRTRVMAIVAHEYGHAWMEENLGGGRELDRNTIEGFCELLAFKIVSQRRFDEEIAFVTNNTYTAGQLDALRKAEDRYNFHELVQWLKYGHDEMIDPESLSRVLARTRPVSELTSELVWQTAVRSAVPDTLVLKGISGTPQRRFALINDTTLERGEQAKVRVGTTNAVVRCLDITATSVVLTVNGAAEKTELFLKR